MNFNHKVQETAANRERLETKQQLFSFGRRKGKQTDDTTGINARGRLITNISQDTQLFLWVCFSRITMVESLILRGVCRARLILNIAFSMEHFLGDGVPEHCPLVDM